MSLIPELMHIIGLMLPLPSIMSLMRVNKEWYRVLNTNYMWRDLYRRDFPLDPSERTLKYEGCGAEELFLHSEEIHYETLYRLTYIIYPYLEAGRKELTQYLQELYEELDSYDSIVYVNSAQDLRQQRALLYGQTQADEEWYTEGYSDEQGWKIDFIHCTHSLIWRSHERLVQDGNIFTYEHVGYRPIKDVQELSFVITHYERDDASTAGDVESDRCYFYIGHSNFLSPREIIPVPLTNIKDIEKYVDLLLSKGYVPVPDDLTLSDKQVRDYNTLLHPTEDE